MNEWEKVLKSLRVLYVEDDKEIRLLCTGGLTEAENASGEPFGDERCDAILRTSPADRLFDNILGALEHHLGRVSPHDDLSVVLAQCGG